MFACNVSKNEIEEFSYDRTGDESVAKAVAASCSIPLYFTPTVFVNEELKTYYVDGGLLINRPDHKHHKFPTYFQALSFKLISNKHPIDSFFGYAGALVNTLIQGADEFQHNQHKRKNSEQSTDGHEGVNEVVINTGNISATDFRSLTKEDVDNLIRAGEDSMTAFLNKMDSLLSDSDKDTDFTISPSRAIIENDGDYILNQVAFWSYEKHDPIWISDYDLDWVWPLFPTLISWIQNEVKVTAFYDSNLDNDPDNHRHQAKKRLLENLGVKLKPTSFHELILGYYFKKQDKTKCILFKKEKRYVSQGKDGKKDEQFVYDGKVYNGEIDSVFIDRIIGSITNYSAESDTTESGHTSATSEGAIPTHHKENIQISLKELNPKYITDALKSIEIYNKPDLDIEYTEKPVKELKFLKKEIRSLKYKELRIIDSLYTDAGKELYETAKLDLSNGKTSPMTPIIAEEHEEEIVVIKGNTRCFKLYKEKGNKYPVKLFIVKNPPALTYKGGKLPLYSVDQMHLSEGKNRGKILLDGNRPYDQALRPDEDYLQK